MSGHVIEAAGDLETRRTWHAVKVRLSVEQRRPPFGVVAKSAQGRVGSDPRVG